MIFVDAIDKAPRQSPRCCGRGAGGMTTVDTTVAR